MSSTEATLSRVPTPDIIFDGTRSMNALSRPCHADSSFHNSTKALEADSGCFKHQSTNLSLGGKATRLFSFDVKAFLKICGQSGELPSTAVLAASSFFANSSLYSYS